MRLLSALVLLACLAATPAWAQRAQAQRSPPPVGNSLDESVRQVERQDDAQVIRADAARDQQGNEVHRIKVLTDDGRVRVMNNAPPQGSSNPSIRPDQSGRPGRAEQDERPRRRDRDDSDDIPR
jgi:hypothetical protein